jgi:site-specific DNA recombinase
MDEGVQILELARNAQPLFGRQEPRQKRRLLDFVLSNCSWEDGEMVAAFRQPFDISAETAVAERQKKAAGMISDRLSVNWLPGTDSNHRQVG